MKMLSKNLVILMLVLFSIALWGCTKRPVYRTTPPAPLPTEESEVSTSSPEAEEPPPPPVDIPVEMPEKEKPSVAEPIEKVETPPPVISTPVLEGNLLEDFENMSEWSFRGYPEEVTGTLETYTLEVHDGIASGRLSYNFSKVPFGKTGAAYMSATKVIPLNTNKISLWIYGNGSSHWLRIRFVDAKGIKFVADLAREVDWKDEWKKCTIEMNDIIGYNDEHQSLRPKLPLTMEYIYLVCETNGVRDQGKLIFDNLMAE